MAFIFAGIVVFWLFHRQALLHAILALAFFVGLHFIAPENTPEFPWTAIFFFSIGVLIIVIHLFTKYEKESVVEQQANRWFEEQARLDQLKFQKWREEQNKSS